MTSALALAAFPDVTHSLYPGDSEAGSDVTTDLPKKKTEAWAVRLGRDRE